MKTIEQKARAYDKVREKIALRFGSNVAEEIFSEFETSEDEKIRKDIINYFKCQSREELSRKDTHNKWIAWLEKVIIPNNNDIDSSFIEDIKNVITEAPLLMLSDKKKMIAWLEKQGQKPAEWKQENREELTEFENAMMHIGSSFFGENAGLDPNDTATVKEQAELLLELASKTEWSEEDERLCSCLIKEQEESLDNVRNDKYGHSEIISDLKDMYHERIDWLKSLKQRIGG